MQKNRQTFFLVLAVGLLLWLTGCEVPDAGLGLSGTSRAAEAPHSNFVPPRKNIRIGVNRPLPIESYHLTRTDTLGQLRIWVNGQPVRSEQATGQATFPEYLGTMQVLERGYPPRPEFSILEFPAAACRGLLEKGGPVQANLVVREYPASTWTVCHIWIGRVPGVYELTLQVVAFDANKREIPGKTITQRIEVLEES